MMKSFPILRIRKATLKMAFVGLLGMGLFSLRQPGQFYRSYLFAYLLCLGIGLGCLGFLLLHSLTGGAWGKAGRHVFQSGADTLPWLAALFLPILFGLHRIYPWMDPMALLTESPAAAHKRIYFALPFFMIRAAVYFALWWWMGLRQRESTKGSGIQLLVYVLTVSFSSFDWVMSLEPNWSSSIYGAMLMVGDVLSALAFAVLVLNWRSQAEDGRADIIPDDTAHDLGNLLLAFVMLWAYMGLSQYMIIWSGNLPEEISWYLVRQRGGWQAVAILLILFQFALPFLLLLARKRKRKLESLARVAGLILVLRVVDVFWLTAPDFSPGVLSIHVLDFLALLLVGGAWMSVFCSHLQLEETA